jgi:hypothetical protein
MTKSVAMRLAAVSIAAGLFLTFNSSLVLGKAAAPLTGPRTLTVPAKKDCKEKRWEDKYSGTFALPGDCGASGSFGVPQYTQQGSPSSFGIKDLFCESPALIHSGVGSTKFCYDQVNPLGHCKEASSTFWYMEANFQARVLDGYGSIYVTWESDTLPITFTSPTMILPGDVYGLCVLIDGGLTQDDFVSGTTVSPNGDTVNLNIVLPSQDITFMYDQKFSIYLEYHEAGAAPAGFRRGR